MNNESKNIYISPKVEMTTIELEKVSQLVLLMLQYNKSGGNAADENKTNGW